MSVQIQMLNQYTSTVTVITPTIGNAGLKRAVSSVLCQLYKNIIHWLVVDGEQYKKKVLKLLTGIDKSRYKLIVIPFNTGDNGYNGHRIYASCAHLVNTDYICFLDEDNWYDEDHVGSLIRLIQTDELQWAYSLRKICYGDFVINDNCESLGRWPPAFYDNQPFYSAHRNLVDTSC